MTTQAESRQPVTVKGRRFVLVAEVELRRLERLAAMAQSDSSEPPSAAGRGRARQSAGGRLYPGVDCQGDLAETIGGGAFAAGFGGAGARAAGNDLPVGIREALADRANGGTDRAGAGESRPQNEVALSR